jgi:hypothetical protein
MTSVYFIAAQSATRDLAGVALLIGVIVKADARLP